MFIFDFAGNRTAPVRGRVSAYTGNRASNASRMMKI